MPLNLIVIVLSLLSIILPVQTSKGAKLEFDEGASSSTLSVSAHVYAGQNVDDDSWQTSDIIYDRNLSAYAGDNGAWSSGSASIYSDVNDAYSDEDGYLEEGKLFDFTYDPNFEAHSFWGDDYTIITASFSAQVDVNGVLYWNFLPSNPNENEGDPYIIGLWDVNDGIALTGYSFLNKLCTNEEYWDGSQKLGPYYGWSCSDWPGGCCTGTNPDPCTGLIGLIAKLGDTIKLSYNVNVEGYSNPDFPIYSAFYSRENGGLRLRIKASVEPLKIELIDKGWVSKNHLLGNLQDRDDLSPEMEQEAQAHADVNGACADGATKLVLSVSSSLFKSLEPGDIESPARFRLRVLSPEGKDNGQLVLDGQDNDNDGYDDKPRIKNETFTQTWIAPPVFDSVLGSANKEKMRKIPIQIEIDKDGVKYEFTQYIELVRPPVILVHGWRPALNDERTEVNSWASLKPVLQTAGYDCNEFSYGLSGGVFKADGNPAVYANDLKKHIDDLIANRSIANKRYAGKFDIICHSMGALVSRWYMEKLGGVENIRQWIGIAPVNHGAAIFDDLLIKLLDGLIPDVFNLFFDNWTINDEAIHRMQTDSDLVKALTGSMDPTVKYRVVVGWNHNKDRNFRGVGGGKTYAKKNGHYYWTFWGDGGVAVEQSLLAGTGTDSFAQLDHNTLLQSSDVCKKIRLYLEDSRQESGQDANNRWPHDGNDIDPSVDIYVSATDNQGNLPHGVQCSAKFKVDSTVRKITAITTWPGSDVNLRLISPTQEVMEPNTYPVEDYWKKDNTIWYIIDAPVPGVWTAELLPIDVPAEGEPYSFAVFYASPLSLELTTSEGTYEYGIGGAATLIAELKDANEPITGATVLAEVNRPGLSTDEVVLYDDGSHGDMIPNDGNYTNIYCLAGKGEYEVRAFASGTVGGESFERIDIKTLYATLKEDFNYDDKVDFRDFAILANFWMRAEPSVDIAPPPNGDGAVNVLDLAVFAQHWLEGVGP